MAASKNILPLLGRAEGKAMKPNQYAARQNKLTAKDKAALSKWAAPHPTTEQEAKRISEERRLLWIRLNEFCTERSGAITTKPFASPARLEVPPESELPKR